MMSWVGIDTAVEITNNRVKPFQGKRQYLSTGDLSNDGVNGLETVDYESKPSRADLLIEKGDLVVARMKATNKVLLIDDAASNYIVSTGFLTLKPKKEFNASYLLHYLKSSNFQTQKDKYCSGATQKAINNTAFYKLKVPMCTFTKQGEIADIFDCLGNLRQKREESILLLDNFIRAIFIEIFGDLIRNDKSWKIKPVGDVCEARLGKMLDSKKQTGKHLRLYLRNANVQWDSFKLGSIHSMDFNEADRKEFRLRVGDVLVCEGGDIGRTAIWENQIPECYFQKALHRLRFDLNQVIPEYFVGLMWFYSKNDGFKDYVSSVTIAHLTGEKLSSMKIPLPPIALQERYSKIVNKTKYLRSKMFESQFELGNQFNALMQKYFG